MKFKPFEDKLDLPWIDGAILHFKRPDEVIESEVYDEAEEKAIKSSRAIGLMLMERYLTGWENIDNENTGEKLEFNIGTRNQVFRALRVDFKNYRKFLIFMQGPTGNLQTGSTASLTTAGAPEPAADAS